MPNWVDGMVAQERHKDMVREEEQAQRIAQMSQSLRYPSLLRRLVYWLNSSLRRAPAAEPRLQILGATGSALPIETLHEPPEGGTGHYLN